MKEGIFPIFRDEVVRIFTHPKYFFFIVGIPLVFFIYYASILSEGVPQKLPITVFDQDNSKLSRQLTQNLNATSSLDVIKTVFSYEEGEKSVKTDETYGFVVIPQNFEKDLNRGENTQVVCYYNGNYLFAGSLINKAFLTTVGTFSAGANIKSQMMKGKTQDQAYTAISPVDTDVHMLFNPFSSYYYFLELSLLPMSFQIVIIVITIYAFGSDLKYNRGKQMYAKGGNNVLNVLIGKMLPYTIVFSILGFFMNSLIFYKIGTPFKGSFFVINLIFIGFTIACQMFAFAYVSLSSSLRTALTFGGGMAALSFSFAGYTFPMEGMPYMIQKICYIFPLTSYINFLVDYGIRGISLSICYTYIFVYLIFFFIGVLTIPKYKKLLIQGRYHE